MCKISSFSYDYRENLVWDGEREILQKISKCFDWKNPHGFNSAWGEWDRIVYMQWNFVYTKSFKSCYSGYDHVSLTCSSRPSESSMMRHGSFKEATKNNQWQWIAPTQYFFLHSNYYVLLREVWCILDACVKDVKRNLPILVQSSGLYLLWLCHDVVVVSLRAIKIFQGLDITE